jgi:hypothetical protein
VTNLAPPGAPAYAIWLAAVARSQPRPAAMIVAARIVAVSGRQKDRRFYYWEAVSTCARETGLSHRGVQYGLRELEATGFLQSRGSRKGGRAKTIRYVLHVPGGRDANPVHTQPKPDLHIVPDEGVG